MTPLRFGFTGGHIGHPSSDTLPLRDRVAARLLAMQASAAPARPLVHVGDRWLSYAEVDARANRSANALAGHGIGKGSRVAVLMRNRIEFLDLWFGLSRLQAIQVPLNPEYRALQIEQVLRRAPIDMVVVEHDLVGELDAAIGRLDRAPTVAVLGSDTVDARRIDYARITESASERAPASADAVSGADPGAVMNTSGTTGPSKGVLVSHAQQYVLGRMIAADIDLQPDDVFYNFFPLFHNTAQAMITLPVLLVGARMVLTERFSASRFWSDSIQHGCTAFYYIGEIVHILLKTTTARDADGARLRVGWGIGPSAKDFVEFQDRFGIPLRTGYGSTEANVPCFMPHGSTKVGSAGRAVPGFQVRIANESGEAVPPGVQGEILVRADEPFSMMLGYDGDPAATVQAWQHLWLHTGDAGVLDEDGDLFFKGRVRDSIRVRGENVSAYEVEQALAELAEVAEVAAIAVPCDLGGDDLKVVVVLKEAGRLTHEALIDHAQRRLPKFSIPRYVEFVDGLPKTPTNKVQKHVLRATPFTSFTWDRIATLGR